MMGNVKTKKMFISLYVLILSTLFYTPFYAQELFFKKLTVENGLSQNDVNSIVRDSYGFIWIGTYDGLNRFDGRNLETFRRETANPASLPDNRISALFEDNNKRLWIGTGAGLFSYYSLLKDQFIRVKSPENTGVIFNFLLANDDKLYAITSKGVLRLNENTEPEFEYIEGLQNHNLRDGIQLPNGELLFAGNYGILLLQGERLIKLPNPENLAFTSLVYTGTSILAGGGKGLFTVDKISGVNKLDNSVIPEVSITSMTKDQEENIWIGTQNNGLLKLDSSLKLINQIISSRTNPRGLLSNTVLKLYHDRFNNLWVGNRHGLCYTNLHNTGFRSLNLGTLNVANVRSMAVDDNVLILGINNEGLFKYDLQKDVLMKR